MTEKWRIGMHNGYNASNVYADDKTDTPICAVFGIPLHTHIQDVDIKFAKGLKIAALIAAAPDLLEACKKTLLALEACGLVKTLPLTVADMKAAIRKAEGGAE